MRTRQKLCVKMCRMKLCWTIPERGSSTRQTRKTYHSSSLPKLGYYHHWSITDLIPDAVSYAVLLLLSALHICCGVWDFTFLHYLSHFSQNESLALKLQYFHKMQNAVLVLSQETKERIAEESILRHANLSLSTSLSLGLLLCSLSLSCSFSLSLFILFSQSLYPTQFILPFSFLLSFPPSPVFLWSLSLISTLFSRTQ